jgi:hypothetical protein
MNEVIWEVLSLAPTIIVGLGIVYVWCALYKESRKMQAEWDEEVKRRKKVKDLYSAPPSYEERMGVSYGPKKNE